MQKNNAISVLVIVFIILTVGCGTYEVKSDVPEKLGSLQTPIVVDKTTRYEVHKLIGSPIINSKRRNVEVHRATSGHDVEMHHMLGIPLIFSSSDVIIYAMILYDKKGVVRDIDWGIFSDKGYSITLTVGDFSFYSKKGLMEFTNQEPVEYLFLTTPSSREELIHPAPAQSCYLTIQLANKTQQVWLDEILLLKDRGISECGYIQIPIEPGNHKIKFITPWTGWRPREFSSDFSCSSGDLIYAYLDTELVRTGKSGFLSYEFMYEGGISLDRSPPYYFHDEPKILYISNRWFDNKEMSNQQ